MRLPDGWAPILPHQAIALPEDFLWGVAFSAFQAGYFHWTAVDNYE